MSVLGGSPNSDKFCLGYGYALRLSSRQVQVVATSSSGEGLDIPIDCFDDAESDLDSAIVEDAVQVRDKHISATSQKQAGVARVAAAAMHSGTSS